MERSGSAKRDSVSCFFLMSELTRTGSSVLRRLAWAFCLSSSHDSALLASSTTCDKQQTCQSRKAESVIPSHTIIAQCFELYSRDPGDMA